MKALVTGATGFIGGRLARRLLEDGWEVRVLARRPDGAAPLAKAGAHVVAGDVTRPETLDEAMKGVDAVFHAAASVDVIKPDRAHMMRTNVEGTRNVLSAAVRTKVPRVVYLSSVAAIGRRHRFVDENVWNDGHYLSLYEESKHRSEQVALEFGRQGLDLVHVLPVVVIGADDPKFGGFIKRYIRRGLPGVPRKGGSISFVHVDDLVEGVLLAYAKGRPNERYIFAQATWDQSLILERLHALTGVRPPPRFPDWAVWAAAAAEEGLAALFRRPPRVSRQAVRSAGRRVQYSSEKARQELGWRPKAFDERFAETVRALKAEVNGAG